MLNKKTSYKMQKGFTLVELAIVLVIIGLIVSSVLVGQDLIKAAQLRSTVRQLNDFQIGVNTFIGKYNGIPGDLSTASTFVGTWNNGNGDGTLTDGGTVILAHTGEMGNFWTQLTTSGKELIQGSYAVGCTIACTVGTDIPALKFGANGWAVYGVSGVNYFLLGASFPSPSVASAYSVTNSLTPQDAFNIDSKIDDGIPNSGSVIGGIGGGALTLTGAACGTTAYIFATTTPACTLQFTMQTF